MNNKTFGALIRQLRTSKGYSVRGFAKEIGVSYTFLSDVERGKKQPPSEEKIILMADALGQNKDELLGLAGKVASDVKEIILQRPKDYAALLRRLNHASAAKIRSHNAGAAPTGPLEFYPLETISRENHTAVIGESGSGKSLLTKYLIGSYFEDADIRVYDSDAAPDDWGEMDVVGRKGDYAAIAKAMAGDLDELKRRTVPARRRRGPRRRGGARDRGIPQHRRRTGRDAGGLRHA